MKRPPYFSVIRSNLDGQKLAVASGDDRSRITLVDLDTSTVSASEVVGFQVSAMQFTQDGSGLMVYGTPAQGSTQGDPQVVLLAADDLQPVWQESISGIKDGIYPKDSTATNLHEPGAAEMYRPGIAFAPNQDVLYLVHSDAPLLTTVDFKARTSVIKEIKPQLSWIDRLMHLTAGIAHAKIIDGTLKQAVISADGSHLFVVGMVNEFKPLKNGEFELVQTPLAMQSIDTRDGALLVEVPALPSNSGWFELSMMSDDQFLILKSFENTKTETHLYDSNTLQLVEAIPNMEVHASRNLSGQPVLVGIRYNSRGFGAVMEAYSPNSLDSLGSWKPAGSFFWLRP